MKQLKGGKLKEVRAPKRAKNINSINNFLFKQELVRKKYSNPSEIDQNGAESFSK